MLSFHNDPTLYQEWGALLKAHAAADELVQGRGWENGKGCFIGCSIHEYSHEKFAQKFDLPIVIPRLADILFERAETDEAKTFAIQIWEAMRVGVDYSKFTHHWRYWLICDPEWGVIRFNSDPRAAYATYATCDADAVFASSRSRYRSAQRSKFLQLLRTVQ